MGTVSIASRASLPHFRARRTHVLGARGVAARPAVRAPAPRPPQRASSPRRRRVLRVVVLVARGRRRDDFGVVESDLGGRVADRNGNALGELLLRRDRRRADRDPRRGVDMPLRELPEALRRAVHRAGAREGDGGGGAVGARRGDGSDGFLARRRRGRVPHRVQLVRRGGPVPVQGVRLARVRELSEGEDGGGAVVD
eukprot:30723-Pelagococcus_subviridis.AAC.24